MIGWVRSWNAILRNVIFKDHDLKKLMMVPNDIKLIPFVDRYFVRAGYTNKLLTDEKCRIVYSDAQGSTTSVPNIIRSILTFDIYVKTDELRTATNDGLLLRTQLIAGRLAMLLTKERYVIDSGYRFWPAGDWDLGTRTSGYARYTISFYYMKVY